MIQSSLKKLPDYLPSGLLAFAFLLWHYQETAWIGYHANSPWAASFEKIEDINGLIKNIAVLGWRFLDFGRIFLWLIILIAGWILYKNNWRISIKLQQLILLLLLSVLILSPSQLLHKYLVVHRYNMPLFIILTFIGYHLLFGLLIRKRNLMENLFLIAFLGLLSGNLWVYPKKISQGWDSTLAHLPYYELRDEMFAYIEQNNLPLAEIGTAFPEIGAIKFKDLSQNEDGFVEKDLKTQQFILYSNVMNDFTDQEIENLEKNWEIVQEYRKMQVYYILYRKVN